MKSVWSDNCHFKKREVLNKDIEADILVIGAGMAGILIAYMLKKNGMNVVLIDAGKTAGGNTQNTTAKITSQHNLIYNKLISEFGEEKAKQYAKANESAIKKFKEIIEEAKIDCDFEEKAAYIYSRNEIEKIKEEVEAANRVGINAEFVEEVNDLPFKINGAVKFNNQAQFNPLKFLKYICEDLVIYENTRALEIKENLVITNKGNISANNIVVATHYPIMNVPGFYFLKMHQERSYVLALKDVDNINGMYIDVDENGYSFRNYKDLLLFGGIKQRTGENETGGSYEKLRKAAKELYPNSKEVYCWSAQDCMTIDGIPYIGRYSDDTPNIYVATGFNKWGMTSSMVSAMLISDMISGKENNYSEIFSPKRFDLSLSISNVGKDISKTAKNFIAQKIYIPSSRIEHIQNGHAGIVEHEGEKVGVYKNIKGEVFFVSTKCAHLGCELHWNADELTWDCPCHGSRFDYNGRLIESPATKNLVDN